MDIAAFNSIELQLTVTNTNTKKEIKRRLPPLQVVEILEEGMTLDLPRGSAAPGHYLVLRMDIRTADRKETKFSSGARVDGVTNFDESSDQVAMKLIQYDKAAWNEFLSLFNDRQKEIDLFLAAVKG